MDIIGQAKLAMRKGFRFQPSDVFFFSRQDYFHSM